MQKKKIMKNIIRIRFVFWVIGFCFIFSKVETLLMVKNHSLLTMDDFYSLEQDSLDIVLLGSSHIVNGVNSQIIENVVGGNTFSCAIIGQTAPVHVSYLDEVLKYQHPKLLIIDIYRFRIKEYTNPPLSDFHESMDGLKFSPTKIKCIYKNTDIENILEYILPIVRYHSRWKELRENDFKYLLGMKESSNKGFKTKPQSKPQNPESSDNTGKQSQLPEKTKKLLSRIIDVAANNNIDLLFVNLPYAHINKDDKVMFSAIVKYMNTYCSNSNVHFNYIDYNQEINGVTVDYNTDFMDISHLNTNGAHKISNHLAEYINKNYNLGGNERR